MYLSWIVGLVVAFSDFAYLLPKKVSSMAWQGVNKNVFKFYIVAVGPQGSTGYFVLQPLLKWPRLDTGAFVWPWPDRGKGLLLVIDCLLSCREKREVLAIISLCCTVGMQKFCLCDALAMLTEKGQHQIHNHMCILREISAFLIL